ncbi:rhomboid family GlyGly-CTERM serine protease [Idiomarina sp. A28L]|uniref:rhombosortase n=1 Tax=Idiomarina sp. A28L TaxID=1036674 RepID=UPI0002138AE7|nr:rhombosortase [Idiomarina sp. A28L]EGN74299.1 rhomboid family GlyGly-CTERM serine protease [Idiomarina sp. A28L]
MIQLPLNRRYTLAPILVSVLLLVVFLLPESMLLKLTFERLPIAEGEYWRLLSGQFVHFSWGHLWLNIAGIWVMYLLYAEHAPNWRYPLVVCLLALFSNLGMYFFAPEIQAYLGFSGVLYGLFAWGAVVDIRKGIKLGWLLFLGVMLKVSWEYFVGPVQIGTATVDNLAVSAHFFGALGGGIIALVQLRWR